MVDVKATNTKLRLRAMRIVKLLTGLSDDDAKSLLEQAGWSAKTAIVMSSKSIPAAEAEKMLRENGGHLRKVIGDIDYLAR